MVDRNSLFNFNTNKINLKPSELTKLSVKTIELKIQNFIGILGTPKTSLFGNIKNQIINYQNKMKLKISIA